MRIFFTIGCLVLLSSLKLNGQASGDFRSKATGNWGTAGTWETYNGSAWVNAGAFPTSASGAITILSGHTVTVAAIVTIDQTTVASGGFLTITSTLTLNNGASDDLTVNGTLTNNGTLNLTTTATTTKINGVFNNSGTINNSSTARLSFLSGATYDHKFTTTAGVIPTATWDANSTCSISGYTSSTSPPSGASLTQPFGHFTWNCPNQTLSINIGIGTATSVAGNFTISSTGTTGSVNLSGGYSTLTVGGNFVISGSAQAALTTDSQGNTVTVTGNFTKSSSSTFSAATGSGSVDITVGGVFSNTGTFNASTSNLTLSSSSSPTFSGTMSIRDLIMNGNGVTIDNNANLSLYGTLVYGGANQTFNPKGSGSGSMTLVSTSDNPAADGTIGAIPSGSTFNASQDVTVQRYMRSSSPERIYRYISSPVTNATVASWQDDFSITGSFSGVSTTDPSTGDDMPCGQAMVTTAASLFTYDIATQDYVGYPTTSSAAPLSPKVGYVAYIRNCTAPTIIDVTGPINQGPQTFSIPFGSAYSVDDPNSYTLVGNPFPSAIDWGKADLTSWNGNLPINIADNSSSGDGTLQYIPLDYTPGSVIALGQAFWVSTQASGSFLLTEDSKADFGSSYAFYRTQEKPKDRLTISLSNGKMTDKAYVKVSTLAKNTYDRYDGAKLDNDLFDLSTLSSDNISVSINAVNSIACGSPIKLKSKDLTAGNYTMSLATEGVFGDYNLPLMDAYTGTTISNIASQPYSFKVDANAASKSESRFQLMVSITDADFTRVNDTTLQANYAKGIKWYYNNELLPDTTATLKLKVKNSGLYRLEVKVGSCSTSKEARVNIVTAVQDELESLTGYPNPVSSIYHLELPVSEYGKAREFPVLNSQGALMGKISMAEKGDMLQGEYDFESHAPGVYLIRLKSGKKEENAVGLKVVKK